MIVQISRTLMRLKITNSCGTSKMSNFMVQNSCKPKFTSLNGHQYSFNQWFVINISEETGPI